MKPDSKPAKADRVATKSAQDTALTSATATRTPAKPCSTA
jgi:hypothetical protein